MPPTIIDIPGIGPAAAKALAEHGLESIEVLAAASLEEIAAVNGFSKSRALKTKEAATMLLAAPATAPPTDAPAAKDARSAKGAKTSGKKGKKGKDKRGKKDKKKDKKKGKKGEKKK